MLVYDPNEGFAPNTSINAHLHEILARTSEPSRARMRKRLREHRRTFDKHGTEAADQSARHTLRELLVGDKLNRAGLHLEYNRNIDGKTPDWYDEDNRLIVEVFTCERDGVSQPQKRAAATIIGKVTKYDKIIATHSLTFILAVHGDIINGLDFEDCEDLIADHRLFERFPQLSGVIQFGETTHQPVGCPDGSTWIKQLYSYNSIANATANCAIDLRASLQGP